MNKKEWQEHCKWLDTFRGKIVRNTDDYGNKIKKEKSKKVKKKN
tara:strand:+ start:367 stop:498 length:132 start_codon:yes stop_codon:yes gene_type:complete